MHRLSLICLVGVSALVIGCGGSNPPPVDIQEDVGQPDVQQDEGPGDVGHDVPHDVGHDENPVDVKETIEDVGPTPCQRNSDCADAPLVLGDCQKKVCGDDNFCAIGWDNQCCVALTFFEDDFENGLGKWTLADPKPDDYVTWQISDARRAFGTTSVYFGNPTCKTYYSGALDGNCDPVDPAGADSAAVRASLTSTKFLLPALSASETTFIATAYMWVESEPMIAGIDSKVQPDQFRMSIVTMKNDTEVVEEVYSSTSVLKNSKGVFVFISGNISAAAGKEAAIRLSFDSIDGSNNLYEGVYVDNVKVYSTCEVQCDTGTQCPADDVACTDDNCQAFGNKEGKGSCAYPIITTCVEPQCTTANVATKCPNSDPCVEVSCVEGVCTYTDLPEDQCCRQYSVLDATFEDGTASAWDLWSYLDNQTVKWQASSYKSASGNWSLYYGDSVSRTYDTIGVNNSGEASSPELELRVDNYAFLTFDLYMSTEWDGLNPAEYYNPAQWDLLSVQVVERSGELTETVTDVWTSNNIQGTTGGVFLPVGVDLSQWAGQVVRVRFRFETGNEEYNNFEGVYLDNIKVITDSCIHRNCQSEADCGIDGICKVGSCTDNVCDVEIAGEAGCCANQNDCNDNDECTTDGCVNNVCLHEYVEMPGCCFEDTRADYTFDDFTDLDGFAVVDSSVPGAGGADVRWHLTENKAYSGTRSMYFGNSTTGNFDNGGIARGTAMSPEFKVPATGDYVLSFYVFIDVQSDATRDRFVVDVMDGLTPTTVFTKASIPTQAYTTWFQVADIALNQFAGKTVKLRFSFDSVDNVSNTTAGVFVDSVLVKRNCD